MSITLRNFNIIWRQVLNHNLPICYNSLRYTEICSRDLGSSRLSTLINPQNLTCYDSLKKLSPSLVQIRHKTYKGSKLKKHKSSEYESGSDSDSDDDIPQEPPELQHGSKVVKIQVDSLRSDAVLKHGLGIPRNKLELSFYEGRIRVNGCKIMKKSTIVNVGDEVDIVKKFDEENPELIHVGRVEVLKGRATGDYVVLTVRKFKNLLIENYDKDPWEEKAPEAEQDEEKEEQISEKEKK